MNEILGRARELDEAGRAYVLATVIAVDRPVSAKPGDRALITAKGKVEGWVGGSCSEPIVVREAIASLADGRTRLVRIRPPGAEREPSRGGVITEVTTCASEGGLDVFVEPQLPRPHLVVAGSSPITRTLVKLARTMGYRTTAVVDDPGEAVRDADLLGTVTDLAHMELGPEDAVVVATMNRYDEPALQAALQTDVGYIGLVASRARSQTVAAMVSGSLDRVHTPAGLDLGPSTQDEIALAVIAEVVAVRHRFEPARSEDRGSVTEAEQTEGIDPVCGMRVAIVPGAISADHGGTTYYFCNPGCRDEFLAHPDRYDQTAAHG